MAISIIYGVDKRKSPKPPINQSHPSHHITSIYKSFVKMGVHNIANAAEFKAALESHEIVVLDAYATWCGPCKAISPKVSAFSEQYTKAYFIKVDVDEVPDVSQELGIRAMPTFIIFKNGEKLSQVVGASPHTVEQAIINAVGPA
ncbi:hypothetical protein EYC80_001695 [Monilinia laxa]|uniref:Thioredoxin domain-containing protein n=1 Tax=Monilinia laxa TaxID=61186 RepID=A0A5N6K5Y0_MONLA|nr:hypothetical protein EYC80_001695 [Monilinia laxa]